MVVQSRFFATSSARVGNSHAARGQDASRTGGDCEKSMRGCQGKVVLASIICYDRMSSQASANEYFDIPQLLFGFFTLDRLLDL
jgi:hypothetical protein